MGRLSKTLKNDNAAPPIDTQSGAASPKEPQPYVPEPDDARPWEPPPLWRDPRPDLKADSKLWWELLRRANERSEKLCGILNGFRSAGTRIKVGKNGGWVLRPDIDPTGRHAWASEEEYKELRDRYLKPYIEDGTLVQMLKDLAQTYKPPAPGSWSW